MAQCDFTIEKLDPIVMVNKNNPWTIEGLKTNSIYSKELSVGELASYYGITSITNSNINGNNAISLDVNGGVGIYGNATFGDNVQIDGYVDKSIDFTFNLFPRNTVDLTRTVSPVGTYKYAGAVLAPNGNVYCVPSNVNHLAIINTRTDTMSTITNVIENPTNGWFGGALAPNGRIYCAPHNSTYVLIIDPKNNTVDSRSISGLDGTAAKWAGAVLAPNGQIYCVPANASQILVINPVNNTRSFINVGDTSAGKWQGGVLAPNGRIYCAPYNSGSVLIINPENGTFDNTTISGLVGAAKYSGGCLAQNGKIYFMPALSLTNIMVVNTRTNAVTYISTASAGSGWSGAVYSYNDRIYCIPYDYAQSQCLVINPNTDTIETVIGGFPSGSTLSDYKYFGGILAPNGRIYCAPSQTDKLAIIKTNLPIGPMWMLGAHFNKF